MPGIENYQRHPGKKLERVLAACGWEPIGHVCGLWEMGQSRIFVDHIGIFLYRRRPTFWLRVAGLSHNRITQLHERRIFIDGYILDLNTGK